LDPARHAGAGAGDRVLDCEPDSGAAQSARCAWAFRSARWVCLPGRERACSWRKAPTSSRAHSRARRTAVALVARRRRAGLVDTVGVSQGRGEAPTSLARITSMTDELERAPWSYLASRQEEAWRIGPVALLDEQTERLVATAGGERR